MMQRRLGISVETWPIAGSFTIARGSRTEARVVVVLIEEEGRRGRGECVPYARYGETAETVCREIESARALITSGCDREALRSAMPPGAARNAVDCALWDLEAKRAGVPVHPAAVLIFVLGGALIAAANHTRHHSAVPLLYDSADHDTHHRFSAPTTQ